MRESVLAWSVWAAVGGLALSACGDRDDGGGGVRVDAGAGTSALGDAGDLPSGRDAGGGEAGAAGNDRRPEGVAHCYTTTSARLPATGQFWTAFRGGRLEDRAASIAALAEAAEQYPDEEEVALLHGLANLWRVAEPLPEEVADMNGFIAAALAARAELERAYELCPTDHRIAAWLGPILVNQGRALMDDATVESGLDVLRRGIEHYPSFVLFSKLLVYADRPRDDPDFQHALDAVAENMAVCEPGDPACSNHPHAAHNVEGASVFLGDVFAKAGDRARAADAYAMALDAGEYGEWDYQALLAARIDTLDARIAAYDDADPDNDPIAAWSADYQCSICHRQ